MEGPQMIQAHHLNISLLGIEQIPLYMLYSVGQISLFYNRFLIVTDRGCQNAEIAAASDCMQALLWPDLQQAISLELSRSIQ